MIQSAMNVHNYKECDKLTEQISVLKGDMRRPCRLRVWTLQYESAGCSMDESMSGNEKANDHQSELHSQPCQMESESCSILEPIQESDQDSHSEDDRSTVVVSSEAEESPSVCHSPVNIHTPRLQREDAFIHSPSTSHSFW